MWNQLKRLASSLGPGLITAALVLGPGSVTVVSRAGATRGFRLVWVVAGAGILMAAFTSMAARIGSATTESLLSLVRRLYGRWLALLMGICAFLVCACFQTGDNLGVSVSLQVLSAGLCPTADPTQLIRLFSGGFTLISVIIILASPNLYQVIERIMTTIVGIMIICFFANLVPARPPLAGVLGGFIPRTNIEDLSLIVPVVATTFSVIAALYQGYMVQNKGWTMADYRRGIRDAIAGIAILVCLSIVIMITAATLLQPRGITVRSAGEMAIQLEPLLGRTAKYLFSIGLWGASFSSLVANAIVGGSLLADALGWGRRFEDPAVKGLTVSLMLIGAVITHIWAAGALSTIVVAQALTIPFVPLCALVLVLLANKRAILGEHVNGVGLNSLATVGLAVVTTLAVFQLRSLLGK
ncbi:MAG: Nramp family divalent metal transporter [Kiritimatiellia bacterium]